MNQNDPAVAPSLDVSVRHSKLENFISNGGIVITLLIAAVVITALAEPRFFNQMIWSIWVAIFRFC